MKALASSFFDRPADQVAHDLIGCRLHWTSGEGDSRTITEVEAYTGTDDMASHAARGRTKRNEAMFAGPGTLYIYLCYGLHWMLNVVTGQVGFPAAVLIRSLEGIKGPGSVTKAIGITGTLNGRQARLKTGVWFAEGQRPPRKLIQRSARIGVDYAGPIWSTKPLNTQFQVIQENSF